MRRTMAAGFWSLCLFAPLNVAALGVGDITLESALNQPFAAEIPFESYVESDFDGLSVQLASSDTFKRYGLDLPLFLKGFDFSVAESDAGRPVIRITSARPVSEPFVTLLLDIKWASGRLLREYTVLLDPPVFEAPGSRSAVEPAVAASAATNPDSRNQTARGGLAQAASAAPSAERAAPAPRRAVPAAASLAPAGSYSVQRRDTLWGIAERVSAGTDITVNQAMLALYNANPEAFLGNINRLKAGAVLRIPEAQQLDAVAPGAATAAVREQNARFASGVGSATEAAARLELRVPGDTGGDAASAAAGEGLDSGNGGELDSRIGQLESELEESRRLLEMKDAELAALQSRIAMGDTQDAAGADEPMAGDVALDEAPLADGALDMPADDGAAGEPLATEVFADESADELADDIGAGAGDAETTSEVGSAAQQATPVATPAPPRAPQQQPSLVSQLLSSVWLWVSAAVVLLLALFLFKRRKTDEEAPFAMGEGFGETDVTEEATESTLRDIDTAPGAHTDSIVVEESNDTGDLAEFADGGAAADDAANRTARIEEPLEFDGDGSLTLPETGDKETRLEKTISTGAPLNLDQADPIAEAEFHMAYGLYDQAADLLERALESEPDNRAYRVKLLEVYFVWENRDGFMKHAQTLREATPDDSDSDWNKVVILGKQLCPDDPLFSGAVATSPDAEGIDLEFADAGGDTDLDFTLGGTDVPALDADLLLGDAEDAADESGDDDLDFNLGGDPDSERGADEVEIDLSGGADDMDTLEPPTVEATVRDDALAGVAELSDTDDTQETPTVESFLDDDAATMESPALGDDDAASTMETPTLENPMNEPTVESPTLDSMGGEGETTEMPALDAGDLDPDTLLADLDGDFDLPAGDASNSGGSDDLDVDLSGLDSEADDATVLASSADGLSDDDATLLASFADAADGAASPAEEGDSDTVEQPKFDAEEVQLGDTAAQPAIGADAMDDLDLNLEDAAGREEDMATAIQESSLPEDATMTEVGTKLDLARAYIDMGDPDGARSILGEVLDEGADAQQQEARQMLEELGG